MIGLLGSAYPWVKAAHIVFVIFWMAGLFALPRYLVYHQEGLGDAAEEARWTKREASLRRMILTPSLIVTWTLGLLLAANTGLFDGGAGPGWLHAKLALVAGLSGYHGWAVGYARRLGQGSATLTGKQLRLVNEVPAFAIIAIVVLVVVRPF
ncbi:CopD family protein [Sphingomonas sp. RS2018]